MSKIAYVVTQSELGGAQRNILLLAKALSGRHDITVYAAPGGLLLDELRRAGIKVVEVPSMQREISLRDDLETYRFLVKEFRENGYEVIHSHSSKAGLLARMAGKKAGVAVNVYTAHGFVFNEPMSKMKKRVYIAIEKYGARKGTDLITVSERDQKAAKKLGITSKGPTRYIPNGIDFPEKEVLLRDKERNRERFRQVLGIGKGDIVFGSIANFYETKGHRYLIAAFNRLRKENPDLRLKLVLIGQGALQKTMEELAGPGVIFTGYVQDAELLMDSFDCLVLSSVKEGFPFVILEGVKHMVPLIATDVGDVGKVLRKGDLESYILVNPKSASELHSAMGSFLQKRESMERAAGHSFDLLGEAYSLERMVEETEQVYLGRTEEKEPKTRKDLKGETSKRKKTGFLHRTPNKKEMTEKTRSSR